MAKKKRQRDPPIDVDERPYPNFIGPVGSPLGLRIMADKARRDREITANLRSGADAPASNEPDRTDFRFEVLVRDTIDTMQDQPAVDGSEIAEAATSPMPQEAPRVIPELVEVAG
jgi:hypothetical protein